MTDTVSAFVVSLDFELHWGVRDVHGPFSDYIQNIRGARDAIPRILDLFVEYEIAATWATVGFLFADSREELEAFSPQLRPRYVDPRLDPYREPLGLDERDDPLHFAPSLVRQIHSTPRQEIATHTFSHYYCLEAGSDHESFRQDIASAMEIARAKGIDVKSIVLPRNQWNPSFASALTELGIRCYRGNQLGWMYESEAKTTESPGKRGARLLDAYYPITDWRGTSWHSVLRGVGAYNVEASCFLRPSKGRDWQDRLRLRRIARAMASAAEAGTIFHVWWHPHNFGRYTSNNLVQLRRILDHFDMLRSRFGMKSMTMLDCCTYAATMRDSAMPASIV